MAVERRIIVPLIVACALFMQNLDSTALATALPAIAESLGQTPLRLHLAITVFMLSLAALLPMSGWVADRFGAQRVFILSMVIFTGASIACGFATSFEALLVARAVQGAGGALMVPVGRLILIRSVPKSELIAAMALMGMPALIGPIIAPVVAGLILTVATVAAAVVAAGAAGGCGAARINAAGIVDRRVAAGHAGSAVRRTRANDVRHALFPPGQRQPRGLIGEEPPERAGRLDDHRAAHLGDRKSTRLNSSHT